MATQYHVNGPALVYVGPQGTAGGLTWLGYSEDGIDIDVDVKYGEIRGDVGGPEVPQELQGMGMDARIRMALVSYDQSIIRQVRSAGEIDGALPTPGVLIGSNNLASRLVIQSQFDEPWRFFFALCRNGQSSKVGVKKTIWHLNWYSWVFIDPTVSDATGKLLYDHNAA